MPELLLQADERAMEKIIKDEGLYNSLERVLLDKKEEYEAQSRKGQSNMESTGMNFLKFNSKAEACDEILEYIKALAQKSMEDKIKKRPNA